MRRPGRGLGAVIAATALLAVPQLAAASEAQRGAAKVSVIARGLKNPRGIAFGPDHALYVAEAGKGGTAKCVDLPEFGRNCIGRTGAVTRIWRGDQERVVRGLPSVADPSGGFATGPHSASVTRSGSIFITMGLGGNPHLRRQFGFRGRALGHLLVADDEGNRRRVADLTGYEARVNPDEGLVDSNPYGLFARSNRRIVTDAGGNDLLSVDRDGDIRTLAVFPDRFTDFNGERIPFQAVPTSVVRGPDGAYYVGQLTGFPFPVGKARVYRVVPGQRPTVFARGFTNIIDIDFGPDGSLYVLEIAHNGLLSENPQGALIRVAPGGRRSIVLDELTFPGGVAVGSRGKLYVTDCGVCPGTGKVLRITR